MSDLVEKCGNCAFGVREYQHHSVYTRCHRHAPIVYVGEIGRTSEDVGGGMYSHKAVMGPKTAWPAVAENDFCGDFELKDAK